jgi:hypothetical protein
VQNEKKSDLNGNKESESTINSKKPTKKIKSPENKKSARKSHDKKYSSEELKKIDKEIQATWGKMKDALQKGKIKDK